MTDAFRILAVTALDVLVTVMLVVIGCLGSGWCSENLSPGIDLRVMWTFLGMVPAGLYVWGRGAVESVSRRDGVTIAIFLAAMQTFYLCGFGVDWWWSPIIATVSLRLAMWISSYLWPDENDTASPAET